MSELKKKNQAQEKKKKKKLKMNNLHNDERPTEKKGRKLRMENENIGNTENVSKHAHFI